MQRTINQLLPFPVDVRTFYDTDNIDIIALQKNAQAAKEQVRLEITRISAQA